MKSLGRQKEVGGHWVTFIERKEKLPSLRTYHCSIHHVMALPHSSRLKFEDMTLLVSIPRISAQICIISVS